MARMLRRSSPGDFSGDTNSSVSIPRVVRDVGSAPVKVQRPSQWSVGSDPVGVPWHSKSDPVMSPYRTLTPAEGVATMGGITQAQIDTQPVRARRKKWPYLVLGFFVAAAAGGTIAWQLTQPTEEPVHATVEPQPPQQATAPTPPAETPKPAAATVPPRAPAVTKAEPPPAPAVETPKPHPAVAKEHSHPPAVKQPVTKVAPKETAKEIPKEVPKETPKEAPKETKPAVPPGLDCEVTHYSSMRNYPAACPH
jgi:hypothetical protein